jgi:hypothetical protein
MGFAPTPAAALLLAAVSVAAVCLDSVCASGCEMRVGAAAACVCEDNDGNDWDLTSLGLGEHVTTGPADGCTICTGDWNYHFSFCQNVGVPTAVGCSAATQLAAYRCVGVRRGHSWALTAEAEGEAGWCVWQD